MKNFISHVFIGIGRDGHFFTLRQTYERVLGRGPAVLSYHVQNLSQNADEAYEAAKQYAAENGLILKTTRAELPDNLAEIFKGKRNARAEAKRQREETAAAERARIEAAKREKREAQEKAIFDGVFPFGKYVGKKFKDHADYIKWLISRRDEFEPGSILEFFCEVIERDHQDLLASEYADAYLPQDIGKRVTLEGTIKRVYTHNGHYGITRYVTIMTKDKICVVARGVWYSEEGKNVKVTGTIKEKSEYQGQKQTIINRVKEL